MLCVYDPSDRADLNAHGIVCTQFFEKPWDILKCTGTCTKNLEFKVFRLTENDWIFRLENIFAEGLDTLVFKYPTLLRGNFSTHKEHEILKNPLENYFFNNKTTNVIMLKNYYQWTI
uniref:Uncharacterized protein n=1 Tax=Megaselia scalaris TaxID=36166 RepID=T1GV01_MEGSC